MANDQNSLNGSCAPPKHEEWHERVSAFIERQMELADEEGGDMAVRYFHSCLVALHMLKELGVLLEEPAEL